MAYFVTLSQNYKSHLTERTLQKHRNAELNTASKDRLSTKNYLNNVLHSINNNKQIIKIGENGSSELPTDKKSPLTFKFHFIIKSAATVIPKFVK